MKKGDRVRFTFKGAVVLGQIMRIKKDGTLTVKPESDEINEGCYIDVGPSQILEGVAK